MDHKRLCPVEHSGVLDNAIRKIIQSPKKILKPYLKEGMTALDLGCGPGYFTPVIAKLVGKKGSVIAADVQDGMLDKLKEKVKGKDIEQRIKFHKCEQNKIGVKDKVDFVLAFYMIHEVPNRGELFKEIKSILNSDGRILIVEPKFHVSKKTFESMITELIESGFKIVEFPKIFISRAVLMMG